MADLKEFAEQLVNLTVKEVNELADILKEDQAQNTCIFSTEVLLEVVKRPLKSKPSST